MADFPPNLDDGELYLPSDIFPDDILYTHKNPTNRSTKISTDFPPELTYMEDLAQQLVAYGLLERNLSKQAVYPRTAPIQQLGSAPSLQMGLGVGVLPIAAGFGYAGFPPRPRTALHLQPLQSQAVEMGKVVQSRAEALLRQKADQVQHRLAPLRPSNGGGSFVRKSGGTGVFLPRVFLNPDVKKKSKMESPQRMAKPSSASEQKMAFHHPRSDIVLPQEWTY